VKGRALVTNGESPIALAVVRSLGRRGIKVAVGSSMPSAMGFHSKYCLSKFIYPSSETGEDAFIESLSEAASKGGYDVLFIGDNDTLMPVSKHRHRLTPYLIVPMPPHEVMEAVNNKAEVVKAAMKVGVPCPKTYFDLNADTLAEIRRELRLPLIVKPCVGAGAHGLAYVDSFEKLRETYDRVVEGFGPALIQEFVRGMKVGFSGLFNRDSELKRVCVYRHIREYPLTGGPLAAGKTIRNDDVLANGAELLKAFGWYGVANIEFIVDEKDGKPKMLEINSRFFAGLPLTIAAGVDYPYEFYRMIKDGDIEADLRYKIGVKGRSILMGDGRHLLSVLKGKKSPKYNLGKLQTILNFMKFHEYDTDFILSFDDPMPAVNELTELLRRKKLIKHN